MRYHYTYIKITKMKKKLTAPKTSEDLEKLDHLHIASENVKWYSHSVKQFAIS